MRGSNLQAVRLLPVGKAPAAVLSRSLHRYRISTASHMSKKEPIMKRRGTGRWTIVRGDRGKQSMLARYVPSWWRIDESTRHCRCHIKSSHRATSLLNSCQSYRDHWGLGVIALAFPILSCHHHLQMLLPFIINTIIVNTCRHMLNRKRDLLPTQTQS